MDKPEYCQGIKCPDCGSTDTVGTRIIHKPEDPYAYTALCWCSCGCHFYNWFDGVGQNTKVYKGTQN